MICVYYYESGTNALRVYYGFSLIKGTKKRERLVDKVAPASGIDLG
jgi:hypothetical protein